ncbi:hypothetical protein IV73_GL000126 [Weissella kandleri]|uniref:ATPase AAA-type core domain-containing protein n=1 Tax=Weissella kandleri TaxID=1616 RepID=A0A0R2JK29_9LACO|nr:ATP-binding protein [Weissella kandleri]KRN75637.1 hypothetical protein IV73_GL000126 [Weissella kandleri]
MKITLSKVNIKKFRNINNMTFNVGRKITMIIGHNGTGKSNILALLSSASGTPKNLFDSKSKLLGKMQPDYSDYFSISSAEDFSKYDASIEYSNYDNSENFTRKLDFKTDDDTRASHIVPRTQKSPSTDKKISDAILRLQKIYPNVKKETRLPYPTKYISLARVFPRGQDKLDVVNKKSLPDEMKKMYSCWYNRVLRDSISENGYLTDTKKGTSSHRYEMPIKNAATESISTGQDSLSEIISALLEFWIIKDDPKYEGGVLAIDEFDISLHPDAQERLLDLLNELSETLNIQIFLTTHSISAVKFFNKLVNTGGTDNYRLLSIINRDAPMVDDHPDYYSILSNMYLDSTIYKPKVKIYTEDKAGEKLLRLAVDAFNIEYPEEYIDLNSFQIIPLGLGKLQLQTLNEIDDNFSKSIILLDGDGRFEHNSDEEKMVANWDTIRGEYNPEQHKTTRNLSSNEVILPTGFAPEALIFHIMYNYVENSYQPFWSDLIRAGKFQWNPDIIRKDFLDIEFTKKRTFQKMKKDPESNAYLFKFANDTQLLQFWSNESDYNKQCIHTFGQSLIQANKSVSRIKFSSYFAE